MSRQKILSVVGARPNFMKVAPLHRALEEREGVESQIVHTGQHYDEEMSDVFFRQLGLPEPDVYLGVGSGTHAKQTAHVMTAFEEVVFDEGPDVIVVVGDVNSTVACSLVTAKCHVPVAHVEAGLRSGDRDMPEEVNRVVTDQLSDYLFVTEPSGVENLRAEGIADDKIHFVGNVMIDSLVQFRKKAQQRPILENLGLGDADYALMTMHRPSNVDHEEPLAEVVQMTRRLADRLEVIFPAHPRTQNRLDEFGLREQIEAPGVHLLDPLGYLDFLRLMEQAAVVVTDSGGIQEETTFLQVPCLTIRENTERPVTITQGTNELVSLDPEIVVKRAEERLGQARATNGRPDKWDGHAAERIAAILLGEG
ncbi:non-hydrolyzing UDP-N-acetylglucosamine 2-epimerase [Salinibacter ruber]|uniref:non-hydrolyzing UDP-N-acetylglucosamine 2-epimerase n=1 Tax=Salinibacter ruber TaxID=146919 RepID=UPI0021689515|nr:UDP-N-acetylglucosamine 2-epimerase (non-hydrolyzing) [Salinibacter ruber]MCS4049245.1 UDP-N-acetylglucosamine 2-epimerase (non-hydrolyzing) [Salinibacter ruber]